MHLRQPGRGAGAAWRAVDRPFGVDCHVPPVGPLRHRVVGQDRPVQPVEFALRRVPDRQRGGDRPLHRHPEPDQFGRLLPPHPEPEVRRRHDRVEGPAPRHVDRQRPALDLDRDVPGVEVRRHVAERDLGHPAASEGRLRPHHARRRVEGDGRRVAGGREGAGLDQRGRQGDDAVTAHRAIPLVGEEDDAVVGPGRRRRRQDRAVHVGVAARLEQQRPSDVVVVAGEHPPPLQQRRPRQRRHARRDDPQRLPRRVGVDRREDPVEPHRRPLPAARAILRRAIVARRGYDAAIDQWLQLALR